MGNGRFKDKECQSTGSAFNELFLITSNLSVRERTHYQTSNVDVEPIKNDNAHLSPDTPLYPYRTDRWVYSR
jgi:hypothetical protein